MTPKQLKQLESVIGKSIQTHVNGKIDKIDKKLDEYIKSDNAWKTEAEPVIKMGENMQGASKVLLYLAGTIAVVGGAWMTIKKLLQ